MRNPFQKSPEFARLIRREGDVSLEDVAFEIARDAYPDLEIEPYREQLDALADRAIHRCSVGAGTLTVLGQVRWVLHVEEGFRGNQDAYHDAKNSYINDVLDRKLGIPISLSLIYLCLAKRLDLPLEGVGLPAHFMLRVMDSAEPLFVDAFHEGKLLDLPACEEQISGLLGHPIELGPDHIAPCGPVEMVSRMLRNLREITLRDGDLASALPIVRRLASLHPHQFDLQKDYGVLALQAGHPGEAVAPLGFCVESKESGTGREELERLHRLARRLQAERN